MNTRQRHELGTRIAGIILCAEGLADLPFFAVVWRALCHSNIPRFAMLIPSLAFCVVFPLVGFFLVLKAPLVARILFLRRRTGERAAEEDLLQQGAVWSGASFVATPLMVLSMAIGVHIRPWAAIAGLVAGICIMLYPDRLEQILKRCVRIPGPGEESDSRQRLVAAGLCLVGFFYCLGAFVRMIAMVAAATTISLGVEHLALPGSMLLLGAALVLSSGRLASVLSWQVAAGPQPASETRRLSPVVGIHVAFVAAAVYVLTLYALHGYGAALYNIMPGWAEALLWLGAGVGMLLLAARYGKSLAGWLCLAREAHTEEHQTASLRPYLETAIAMVVLYVGLPAGMHRLGWFTVRLARAVASPTATTVSVSYGPLLGALSGVVCLVLLLFKGDLAWWIAHGRSDSEDDRPRSASALSPWLIVMAAAFVVRSLPETAYALVQVLCGAPSLPGVYEWSAAATLAQGFPWLAMAGLGIMLSAPWLSRRLSFGRLVPIIKSKRRLLIVVLVVAAFLSGARLLLYAAGVSLNHIWSSGISLSPPNPVHNGVVVLVRENGKYGAFILRNQTTVPGRAEYDWWYRSDGEGTLDTNDASVSSGRGVTPKIRFGPFDLSWSGHAKGSGWLYYEYSAGDRPAPEELHMCITHRRTIQGIDAADPEWKYKATPVD